jgi:ABC-type transport system substrate-binding protein
MERKKRNRIIIYALVAAILICAGVVVYQWRQAPSIPSGEGVLNLYGQDPYTLDPALCGEATSGEYIMQIFSGLVRLGDTLEPVGDIAQSWQISDDGMTYT